MRFRRGETTGEGVEETGPVAFARARRARESRLRPDAAVVTLPPLAWALLAVIAVALLGLLGLQLAGIDDQRHVAHRQEVRSERILRESLPLLESAREARPALRRLGADGLALARDVDALARDARPLLRETRPLVRDARALLAEIDQRELLESLEAVRLMPRLVELQEEALQRLRSSLATQRRSLDVQRRSLRIQETTLRAAERSLVIQQETLEHARSLDRKTGPPLTTSGR